MKSIILYVTFAIALCMSIMAKAEDNCVDCKQVRDKVTQKEVNACFPRKTKVVTKTVYIPQPYVVEHTVTKTLTEEKNVTKKNNLSLIGIRAYTGLETNQINASNTRVDTYSQVGVGLMYQRDLLDQLRVSIGVTTKSQLLGVGFNW